MNNKFSISIDQFSNDPYGNDLEIMFKFNDSFLTAQKGADLACAFDYSPALNCTNTNKWSYKEFENDEYTLCDTQTHYRGSWVWMWTFGDNWNLGNCGVSLSGHGLILHAQKRVYLLPRGINAYEMTTERFEIFVK
jgi:hypothetical protein